MEEQITTEKKSIPLHRMDNKKLQKLVLLYKAKYIGILEQHSRFGHGF
jgi:hypothetical protein